MDVGIACLFPVKSRTSRAQIVSGVLAVDAVDRVLSQVSERGRLLHGLAAHVSKLDLIDTHGCVDVEADRSGVLADRQRFRLGQTDVLGHEFQREVRLGTQKPRAFAGGLSRAEYLAEERRRSAG